MNKTSAQLTTSPNVVQCSRDLQVAYLNFLSAYTTALRTTTGGVAHSTGGY